MTSGPAGSRLAMSRPAAFWALAVTYFVLLFASAAPTPLYGVYQAQWRFSTTTVTAIFAVYALVLLATLLVFGRLSDYIGRRPVILAGLALNAAACVVWWLAGGAGALFAARALQGASVGLVSGAIGAALLELQRPGSSAGAVVTSASPALGLGAGALAASALVQYGPHPTRLVWWLLLAAFVAGLLVLAAMPESGRRQAGGLRSLRPAVYIPPATRAAFVTALPSVIALWALGALYLSLGPELAAQLLRSANLMWGGLAAFLLAGVGGFAAVAAVRLTPRGGMTGGCLVLLAGAGLTLGAVAGSLAVLFLVGTAIAGVGFGSAWTGVYRMLTADVAAQDRAGLVAAIFIAAYLSFSLPALIAGLASQHYGLHDTALVYCAVVAALVAAAVALNALRRPAKAASPAGPPAQSARVGTAPE
jgi:MFS family permease